MIRTKRRYISLYTFFHMSVHIFFTTDNKGVLYAFGIDELSVFVQLLRPSRWKYHN